MPDQNKNIYSNLSKVAITKNTKKPAFRKWRKKRAKDRILILIITMSQFQQKKINNLICLDNDIKGDGVKEYKKIYWKIRRTSNS